MPQIYDMGPTALLTLRRKAYRGFFRPKNPTASVGFEPANLGTKIQHATPRPPKPILTYPSLNALVTQSKNYPFNVNTTIKLKNVATASDSNDI